MMNNGKHIYLDNHATTQVDSRVLKAMLPYFREFYGNPSSNNAAGDIAMEAVTQARNSILKNLCAPSSQLIFTSCATESIALVFQSLEKSIREPGHIITQATEHKAVLENCNELIEKGWEVSFLKVNTKGTVSPSQVSDAIRPNTKLICIMEVNNEIGSINPISDIASIARKNDISMMVDATQAIGKTATNYDISRIEYYVFSSHKIYGPKGIAGLIVNQEGLNYLQPQLLGGYQDTKIRSGTLNVPGIVGLSKAVEIAITSLEEDIEKIKTLRDRFISSLKKSGIEFRLNTSLSSSVPNNINIRFVNVPNHVLQHKIQKDISLSAGSACNGNEKSHVLKAIGLTINEIRESVRIGIGRFTTEKEIDISCEKIISKVREINN